MLENKFILKLNFSGTFRIGNRILSLFRLVNTLRYGPLEILQYSPIKFSTLMSNKALVVTTLLPNNLGPRNKMSHSFAQAYQDLFNLLVNAHKTNITEWGIMINTNVLYNLIILSRKLFWKVICINHGMACMAGQRS